jgi:peptidyl-prolyl cis-trans isomerase D
MLESLRRGAQTWVAKFLFAILILSFAVWGISGSLQGYGQGALGRVGSIEISAAEYQQAYQAALENLRRRSGGRITAETARAFGFDQQVLQQIVGGAAIDNHTRELQLGISDTALTERLKRDPRFVGADGQFNKAAYTYFLQQSGLTERALLTATRREEVRDQMTVALVESANPPAAMVEALHKFRDETRRIAHFTLDPTKVPSVGEPDDTKLTATYDQNKRRFMTAERRSANILMLTTDVIKKAIVVSDDDVKAAYEQAPDRFAVVERRRIQQLAFPDKAKAEAAAKAIAGGKSFADAAKDAGAKDADIDLGLVTKKSMIDQKIADAAFKLAKDVVSPVIEGRFTTVLLRVTEIEAGKQKALAEVATELRDMLSGERAAAEIQKLYEDVEKGRANGKSLKELAGQFKLTLIEIANVDRGNKTADGKTAVEGAEGERLMAAVFAAKAGAESDAVELGDSGYAWIDLQGTTPEKQREFADAKADVKTLWVETETAKAITAAGKALVDRLTAGEAIEKVAADAGGTAAVTTPTLRGGKPVGLTEAAVKQAFALPLGGVAATDTIDGKSRVVFKVAEIIAAPAITPEQSERIKTELRTQLQRDTMSAYVIGLQERFPVSIDGAALQRASGAER